MSLSEHVTRSITRLQVIGMKPGAVLVDLMRDSLMKCEVSPPGQLVLTGQVTILSALDLVAQVAADASELYARNLFHLLTRLIRDQLVIFDRKDEILAQALVTHAGVAGNCRTSLPVAPQGLTRR